MSVLIVGVDPGITGAVAWIDRYGRFQGVEDLPVVPRVSGRGDELNALRLCDVFRDFKASLEVFLERVHATPQMGVTSSFNFGDTYGVCRTAAASIGAPLHFVSPGVWKRTFQLIGKPKDFSRTVAMNLYPESREYLLRKKDVGRADAILIAAWGLREMGKR